MNNKIVFIVFFEIFEINHMSMLISNKVIKSSMSALVEDWKLKTQSSHNAVANIGNAKNSLSLTIHVPELGRASTSSGLNERTRYGKAKPKPSDRNIGNVTNEGCIRA